MPETAPLLEESIHVEALPADVWRIVSDLRRTGEWSPECRKVLVWGGGAVHRGSRITGFNRRKLVWWPTNSKIHLYADGHAIGWTVLENRTRWSYRLGAEGGGTRLTERREAPEGISRLGHLYAQVFLGGQAEHTDELVEGMRTSLVRIKAIAESA